MSKIKVLPLLFASVILLFVTGCLSRPVMNIENRPVPTTIDGQQLSSKKIAEAITQAGITLGWVMIQKKPGQVNAFINVRGHTAAVIINYNQEKYSINYSDSFNMDYDDNYINHKYNDWVVRLARTIDINLMKIANS